jgi:AraC family transcriptional regulator
MVNDSIQQGHRITHLIGGPELATPFTSSLHWEGLAVERRIIKAADYPRQEIDQHFLMLWEGSVAAGEAEMRRGTFTNFSKLPGTITTHLPTIRPAVRMWADQPVVVCSLSPRFVHDLELELDRRPVGSFQELFGSVDVPLRQSMHLLSREAQSGSAHGTMYVESLFTGLATRLLFTSRSSPQPEERSSSQLPRHILRRVLERMHAQLDSDLSLSTLATESGYSRAHFVRMFKSAIGEPPHSYLLELRLRRAQEMVAGRSRSLIDIAVACGFRSHAHFSAAFAHRFGLPPSLYRSRIF